MPRQQPSPARRPGLREHLRSVVRSLEAPGRTRTIRIASSRFHHALADSIHYLREDHWDELTRESSLFLRRPYLGVQEASAPSGVRLRYAVVYDGPVPAAAVVLQALRFEAGRLVRKDAGPAGGEPERKRERLARALTVRAFDAVPTDVLMCGNLYSWGLHGVAIAPGRDSAGTWPGVADAIDRVRRMDRHPARSSLVVIKDLPAGREAELAAMAPYGYQDLETDPDMVLEIPPGWTSHRDYLDSLNAKYRKKTLQLMKAVEDAGLEVGPLEGLGPHARTLHALYMQVWGKAPIRGPALSEGYLPLLEEAHRDVFRCIAVRRGDTLVGFVTFLKDGDTGIGYLIGVDYPTNERVSVYLRLLQSVIETGIRMGCRRISVGPTALEPKARAGFQPSPSHLWLKHRVPVVNSILKRMLAFVPHEEAPDRNPFKRP